MNWPAMAAAAVIGISVGFFFGVWWACIHAQPEMDRIDEQKKEWP